MIAEPQGTGRIPRMIGRTLAHYEILGLLGSGGMGDVYRARDTKLSRDVALKVLPDEFAADPERRKRFQREARVVAALQHPNIVTIHSVEEDQGVHFLTMELVEGDTLAARIPPGGLPVEDAYYLNVNPNLPIGEHQITVKDVPVDAFWSISMYNKDGYFQKNALDAYSVNNISGKPNKDGSFTVHLGGCKDKRVNCLPLTEGWNYVVRLYKPRKELLDGTWVFPKPAPVKK